VRIETALSRIGSSRILGRREFLAGAISAPLIGAQRPNERMKGNNIGAKHRPKTIAVRPDDITVVPAFHAELTGNLKPPPQPRPSLNGDFCVKGFVKPSDVVTWRLRLPQDGEYLIAVLYNGDNDSVVPGCTIEVSSAPQRKVQREPALLRWWAPNRPFVVRHWLKEPLPLKAGENRVSFRLSSISDGQTKLGLNPTDSARGQQNRDFRLWSMELVRPRTLAAIKQRARDLHSTHGWMVEGKYGLFTHYSTLTYPFHGDQMAYKNWEWGVNLFDVQAYADAVAETGAKWVVFTLAHGNVYWPGPSRTLDRLLPGRTCKRDLLMELANVLEKRGVRFSLYFNWSPGDLPWREACGMNDETGERLGDSFASLFEETSRRYGRKVWGFVYIDSCFSAIYQHDPPWERWTRAIKSGNRDALVGYSPNRAPNVTYFGDLQLGDFGMTLPAPSPPEMFIEGGPYEAVEPGWFIAMDGWIPRQPFNGTFHQGPRFTEQEYVDYFKKMAAARVPVTINLSITQDVTRRQPFFDPRCLAIMRAVGKAVQA